MQIPKSVIEALNLADQYQQEAWLNINHLICGVEVKQMTIRHYYLLDGFDSPFLHRNGFLPADIGIFLWVLSPRYSQDPEDRKRFIR